MSATEEEATHVQEEEEENQEGEPAGDSQDKKKKNKKKSSKGKGPADKEGDGGDEAVVQEDKTEGGDGLSSQEQLLQILRKSRICEESRRQHERKHPFWDTQPVPSIGSDFAQDSGPIDGARTPEDVRAEPYPL